MPTNIVMASETAGEICVDHPPLLGIAVRAGSSFPIDIGPIKYLSSALINGIKGIPKVLKNKKLLIFTVVMALIWIVLTVLPIFHINPAAVKILSFLTCAQGGLRSGIPGIIGGTIAKGVWAYFVFSLIVPIFSGKLPLSVMGRDLNTFFSSLAMKNTKALAQLLSGISLALISYNFLAGEASLQNSMVGLAAFSVSVRALRNKAGFLQGFVTSILRKHSKGAMPDSNTIARFLAGWAFGFVIAILLSATRISIIAYIFGVLLLIAAFILYKKSGRSKEAKL